ncbi:MAG: LysR family transcriptional regulator [Betaproteobacteria bacterium]|nr:LysR family transcriptional regulator [Betaproteobacteria bacterium]
MELRSLRYFVTLAEELHFGRAAKRLSMTQPPLSQAISGLERELGVRLFERTRRRVALTHAGAAFLEEARATLARAAKAVELAQRAERGEVGRLAIGYLAATAYSLLPLVLRDFSHGFPGVRLELRELTLPQQLEALRRGDVEVGLLRPPVPDAELEFETILEEPFVVALPASHPLAALKRVPAQRLASEPFVIFPRQPGLVYHDLVMGFCLKNGFTPRVAQEANQTHTVVGIVSAGIGVALVPASAQKMGLAGVAFRPLREATPASRTAVAWRRLDSSPVVKAFLDVTRRVAKQVNSAAS